LANLEVVSRSRGDSIPTYAHRDSDSGQWRIGAELPFAPTYFPSGSKEVEPTGTSAALYNWTQTSDSILITFNNLPEELTSQDIKIAFSPLYLSILFSLDGLKASNVSHRSLWGQIDSSSCTWTFDPQDRSLSIHLEKRDEGLRWTSLFTHGSGEEVEERLNPKDLEIITASLEKYTETEGPEKDFRVRSTLLGEDGDDVDLETHDEHVTFGFIDNQHHTIPVRVKSLAMPGSSAPGSILVKRGYDALLFHPIPSQSDSLPNWLHTGTFPALDYVLASKRNILLTFHLDCQACLGIESGYSANAYLYMPPLPESKAKTARQGVLRLGESGLALGVGALKLDSKTKIVILCQNELIILTL